MNEIKMYYQGFEIIITQVVGKNVKIRRVDGGRFETASFLRHHRGKSTFASFLTVSSHDIERQA